MISCGFDGFAVKTLTCGIAPASSLFELLVQVCYYSLHKYIYFLNTDHSYVSTEALFVGVWPGFLKKIYTPV